MTFPAPSTTTTADRVRPAYAIQSRAISVLSSGTHHMTVGTADTAVNVALLLAGTWCERVNYCIKYTKSPYSIIASVPGLHIFNVFCPRIIKTSTTGKAWNRG